MQKTWQYIVTNIPNKPWLRLAKQKQHPKYQLTIKVRDWAK